MMLGFLLSSCIAVRNRLGRPETCVSRLFRNPRPSPLRVRSSGLMSWAYFSRWLRAIRKSVQESGLGGSANERPRPRSWCCSVVRTWLERLDTQSSRAALLQGDSKQSRSSLLLWSAAHRLSWCSAFRFARTRHVGASCTGHARRKSRFASRAETNLSSLCCNS